MPNFNFDGIVKPKISPAVKAPIIKTKNLNFDGLMRRKVLKPVATTRRQTATFVVPARPTSPNIFSGKSGVYLKQLTAWVHSKKSSLAQIKIVWKRTDKFSFLKNLYLQQRVPVLAAVLGLFLAFSFGAWFALNTSNTRADTNNQPQVLADQTQTPAGSLVIPGIGAPGQAPGQADNSVLFNTPIEYLKNYFDSINQPDVISARATQLTQFLKDMHSPLVPAAETIAEQSHWQLILAISFAESTLGKNCNDFNCSNIGVGPDSPLWHKYDSYQDWVVDFNRLLDKKYNNWTLQQMCGVYVKPCNPNWLTATQEILDGLKDRNIE